MSYEEWVSSNRFIHILDITGTHLIMLLVGFIAGVVYGGANIVYKVESNADNWLRFSSHNHDGIKPRRRKNDK